MTSGSLAPTDFVVTAVGSALPPDHPADAASPWFDHRAELGRGYRHLPPSCQYLLAAVERALAPDGIRDALLAVPEEERAVAVGTNHGVSGVHAEVDRATVSGEAHLISPAGVPYFSPNLLASRVAMEHGLKGFSLAVHSPRSAGLEALQEGLRALRSGRARWLLAGVTEAPVPEADKAAVHSSGRTEDGALALVVEDAAAVRARGGRALGRVRVRSVFLSPHTAGSASGTERARAALAAAFAGLGVVPPTDRRTRLIGDGSAVARAVAEVLTDPVPAGTGSLLAVREVADALVGAAGEHLVVTATGAGAITVARVVPEPARPAFPHLNPAGRNPI
ncbi:beta-ketoacyl synthase N-terminal-like domain-containing protein [Streptomyces coerulescens]|uniref:Beta-ketoacyl synthase N-terminal-like domain-containing protein n=1 Tax=Streptomyces coerulescens TaxID=29304 RepID=A0ABW0CNC8_STRCD